MEQLRYDRSSKWLVEHQSHLIPTASTQIRYCPALIECCTPLRPQSLAQNFHSPVNTLKIE